MWLLHFFPDSLLQFIVHTVLVSGIVGCFLTFAVLHRLLLALPVLASYYQAARAISVVLLVSGIYLEGGLAAESQWRERVREMELKVAQAEAESKQANAALDSKGTQRVKIIREQGLIIKQYVDREVTKYDSTCVIPNGVVRAHNAAAQNEAIK